MRREILEESGIRTGRVRYLATQPWPFPASLMIGALAEATSETIVRDETELAACSQSGKVNRIVACWCR